MDNAPIAKTTFETLRTVEFRLGLRGYDVDEVDDYLEKVAVEADQLQEQHRQMAERLRQAADRIAQLESERTAEPATPVVVEEAPDTEQLQRTLEMAQRFVDQTKRESEEEAARLVSEAKEHAARLHAEAESRFQADLSRLEGLKTKLSSDVESMARQLETERTRLRSSLSEMIQWIEDNVQPGAAILALRQGGAADASNGAAVSDEPANDA